MGVKRCDRMGCENILCDRISQSYGYICDDCFDELVNSNHTSIEEFMKSQKQITLIDKQLSYEILNKVFAKD